jgi:hypothetical protein
MSSSGTGTATAKRVVWCRLKAGSRVDYNAVDMIEAEAT